ncbi:MAG: HAD hydrolase-like protein [Candidatus Abawacabacteria bacterium]|nr:HAD hydrolase-like protein [Candidatus Abawacabacteria bacterium]
MIKAILFDADGVIINKPRLFSEVLAERLGLPLATVVLFWQEAFGPCLVGKADLKQQLLPYLEQWQWSGSVEDLLALWFKSEHYIDERVVAQIKDLKSRGIECFLSTNQEKYRTDYMVEHMNFGQLFPQIFSSAYVGHKKPHAEYFSAVLEQLPHVTKEEMVLWDDDPENIAGAKSFGIQAELYTNYDAFQHKVTRY